MAAFAPDTVLATSLSCYRPGYTTTIRVFAARQKQWPRWYFAPGKAAPRPGNDNAATHIPPGRTPP